MHQTRKGQRWHFGIKLHIGVDSKTKLIHWVATTPASVHDWKVPGELLHGNETCVDQCAMVMLAQDHQQPIQGRQGVALTLEEANRIAEGAVAKARELNIRISVAVCDTGGRLVAFQRMNGAIWASAYGSQGKAVASAAFGRPSGELSERASQPTPAGIAAAEGGHMIMGQGAVPILRDGAVEGACGVGGGTAQQDEDCARYGVGKL